MKINSVVGSGSSAVSSVVKKVTGIYGEKYEESIQYHSDGSVAGLKQLKLQMVDFAISEIRMTQVEMEENGLHEIPLMATNLLLCGNENEILLDRFEITTGILYKIYKGLIKTWDDQEIIKLNPKITFPRRAIFAVKRSDGSGTTFSFSRYMSSKSPRWRKEIGVVSGGERIYGSGLKSADGVGGFISMNQGSIGYIDRLTAAKYKLPCLANVRVSGSSYKSHWDAELVSYLYVRNFYPYREAFDALKNFLKLLIESNDSINTDGLYKLLLTDQIFDWLDANVDTF